MGVHDAYLAHRVRYLPIALDRARRKVAALEREAQRYGFTDLLDEARSLKARDVLTNPGTVDRAWDREVEIAKRMAGKAP